MQRLVGIVLLIVCLSGGACAGAQSLPRSDLRAASPPSLIVLVTVDQLTGIYLDRFAPQLNGGLARLARGGAWFSNAHHDHAITETAPGHATLLSGRFPRSTGIMANRIGVIDAATPLLGTTGTIGASPRRFQEPSSSLADLQDSIASALGPPEGSRWLSSPSADRARISNGTTSLVDSPRSPITGTRCRLGQRFQRAPPSAEFRGQSWTAAAARSAYKGRTASRSRWADRITFPTLCNDSAPHQRNHGHSVDGDTRSLARRIALYLSAKIANGPAAALSRPD